MGVAARVGASTRFSPVNHASFPARASRNGNTLRYWQHWSEPHGTDSAPWTGFVTVRLRS
jgi:hypothetical protein